MLSLKELCVIVIIYTIAYIYSIVIAPKFAHSTNKLAQNINSMHEKCLMPCVGNICDLSYRGKNYYIGAGNEEKLKELDNCMVTFWGGTHFVLYTILGYMVPNAFWETFAAGVAFELWEYDALDCHDTFDILLNSAGFLVGKSIANLSR